MIRSRSAIVASSVAFVLATFPVASRAALFAEPFPVPVAAGPGYLGAPILKDGYGFAMAASGNTLVVGAPDTDAVPKRPGAVYVWVRNGIHWVQQARLVPPNGEGGDQFGASVAIDGDTLVVGAPGRDVTVLNADRGVAHVFVRNAGTWTFQQTLQPSDPQNDHEFGTAVAVSGNHAVVGAPGDATPNFNEGAAYVFLRTNTTWAQQQKLERSGAFNSGQRLGASVAIDGATVVAGAPLTDVSGQGDAGAAVVFKRIANTWSEDQVLTATGGMAGDRFGTSVAIDGARIAAGAPFRDRIAAFSEDDGAVYVFFDGITGWVQDQMLADGIPGESTANDQFGTSVAIEGNRVVGGAPGADDDQSLTPIGGIYVFDYVNDSQWIVTRRLAARDGQFNVDYRLGRAVALSGGTVHGTTGDVPIGVDQAGFAAVFEPAQDYLQTALLFAGGRGGPLGFSLAVDGDRAVVGAYLEDVGSLPEHGAAYVYVRENGVWRLEARLVIPDGEIADHAGYAVAISGDTVVVGAPGDDFFNDTAIESDEGAAYVFKRQANGSWLYQAKLSKGFGGDTDDRLGWSVAIDGNTAVVGVPYEDAAGAIDKGAVYVYRRTGDAWSNAQTLVLATGAAGDRFGYTVALQGGTLLAGSLYDQVGANADQGSVAFFAEAGGSFGAPQVVSEGAGGSAQDFFGFSLAVRGNRALIGVFGDNVGANNDQGAVWIATRPAAGSPWALTTRVFDPAGAMQDRFGVSVALTGTHAYVGAHQLGGKGAAYRIDLATPAAVEGPALAPDGASGDFLGYTVAASATSDIALAGAFGAAGPRADTGALYVLTTQESAPLFANGFE